MNHLKLPALVLIILGTVTFFSCEKVDKPNEPRTAKGEVVLGGTVRVSESIGTESFLPFNINDLASTHIGNQIHCGLLRLDPVTLEPIPGIAESWSVSDDGLSYVFNLRKGAKFQADECFGNTSREITALDFAYSFEQLCKPNGGSAYETTFRNRVNGAEAFRDGESGSLSGVRVIDDYTLEIKLDKPDASFLYVLAQPSCSVISRIAHEKYGDDLTNGAGPFVFDQQQDAELVVVRNPEYFKADAYGNALPYVDTLIIRPIQSKEQELEALFNDELDIVTGLYLDPVREVLEQHVADFSGKNPKYVLQRETESAGYEVYSVYRSSVVGFKDNFMNYWDFSTVQAQ